MARFTFFLFFLGLLQVTAIESYSQSTKISILVNNEKLENVFDQIEDQSEFFFLYNKDLINVEQTVSIKAKNETVKEILDKVLRGKDISYAIYDRQIVLTNLENKELFQEKDKTISGNVSDENGEPLPGVTVIIKGTTQGTVTDIEGNYRITKIPDGAVLQFSFVGMKTQEIAVASQTTINIKMEADAIGLEEVVAIGYGTIKRSDLTGAVSSVDVDDIEDVAATNLMGSLQGSVAGVNISTSEGTPGAGSSVLIRGLNSIKATNNPLVLIDGVPGSSIDDVDPTDIESIEILKDAASTSIYGSRGTNGVIMVTTKNGGEGKPTFSYNGYLSFATPIKELDLLSPDEYVAKRREMYRQTEKLNYDQAQKIDIATILREGNELDMYNMGKSYDWQKELFQTAPTHSHNISVSGGNKKTVYFISTNILEQTGLVKESGFEKLSARANISSQINSWLKAGTSNYIKKTSQDAVPSTIFTSVYQISPLGKMYEDENNTSESKYTLYPMDPDTYIPNPFTEIAIKNQTDYVKFINSTYLELTFLKDFSYKITANTIFSLKNEKHFTPFYTRQVEVFDTYENARIKHSVNNFLNIENQLNYSKTIGDHSFHGLFVFSTEKSVDEGVEAFAKDFGSDYYGWTNIGLGDSEYTTVGSWEAKTFLESMIGRINYSYQGKYLAQFTIRRDRSSKFSKENRTAYFPGGSIGWRISEEKFMDKFPAVSNLKLRLSYALTGNEGINYKSIYNVGSEVYYTTGQDADGSILDGTFQKTMANKDLQWEKSAQTNIGLDFGFFNGRLSGVLELYKTKTTDLLLDREISPMNGYTSVLSNIGSIENKGIELSLNSEVMKTPDFLWSVSATFAANRNKLVKLYGDGLDDYNNNWFLNEPIGVVYDYVFDGILQAGEEAPAYMDNLVGTEDDGKNIVAGEAKVKDIGGWDTNEEGATIRTREPDGKIDEADKKIIGYTQPDWIGSLSMRFKYKNIDAAFFINHVNGILRRIPTSIGDRSTFLDIPYYTDERPNTRYGRPAWASTIDDVSRSGNEKGYLSYYQDATYTRLQTLTVGYTFPQDLLKRFSIEKLRLYFTAQNLFTITDYIGYDPSLKYDSNQTEGKVDELAGYPTTRQWVFGINLKF